MKSIKNIGFTLLFAALSVVAVSCTSSYDDSELSREIDQFGASELGAPETLTVGFEGSDATRIQLNDALKSVWNEGDEVSVFYLSSNNLRYKFQGNDGDVSGTIGYVEGEEVTPNLDKSVVVYPYDANYTLNNGIVKATLLATQHYAVGSYGEGGNIMVAESATAPYTLKNVCGWLRIELEGEDKKVAAVKVRGNNSEKVAGIVNIKAADATATLLDDADSSSAFTEVTLDCGEGVELGTEATHFYIALLPQTFTKGVTVDVEYVGGTVQTITRNKSITVSRNHIVPIKDTYYNVDFKAVSTSVSDAEIEFTVSGSKGYIIGWSLASSFDPDLCLESYDRSNVKTGDLSYKGSFLSLFAPLVPSLGHNTKYVAWYLECGDDDKVDASDLHSWEFTTRDFELGGTLSITASDEKIGYEDISVKLSTEGHIYMYYKYIPSYEMSAYANDEAIMKMLLKSGDKVRSIYTVTARYEDAEEGDTITLVAAAVDTDGKIGKLFKKEYTTKVINYNALVPTLELVGSPSIALTNVKVTCEGASGYLYAYTATEGHIWKSKFGGTLAKAGEYIIKHEDSSEVFKADADGNISLTGMAKEPYIFVVVALDATGKPSRPKALEFTPTMELGNVVYQSDAAWSEGKPEIEMGSTDDSKGGMFSFVWYVKPKKGYVAYSWAINPTMLTSNEDGVTYETPEQIIELIVSNVDVAQWDDATKCVYSDSGYSRVWYEYADEDNDGRIDDEMKEFTEDGLPGVYCEFRRGVRGEHMIFTTWVDPDGNFHEPFLVDPTTGKEVE